MFVSLVTSVSDFSQCLGLFATLVVNKSLDLFWLIHLESDLLGELDFFLGLRLNQLGFLNVFVD